MERAEARNRNVNFKLGSHIAICIQDSNRNSTKPIKTLHDAVVCKHYSQCKKLLEEGADPNHCDDDDSSLLHILAMKFSKREVRAKDIPSLLLKHGADANAKDKNWNTPLHIAAKEGLLEFCRILIDHQKANGILKINAKNKKVMTPLHLAAQQGQHLVVELLLQEGADAAITDSKKYLPLHHAAEKGYTPCCKLLAHSYHKGSIGRKQKLIPPLLLTARNGHYKCCEAMVGCEVDIDYQDTYEDTALHIVVKAGFVKFAGLLLQKGANPNIQNKAGNTPIMEAVAKSKAELLPTLEEYGALLDTMNIAKKTVLHIAAEKKAVDCMDFLLKRDCIKKYIDNQDSTGCTALLISIKKGCDNSALMLLKAGASPSIVCNQSLSPLHLATENSHTLILEKLLGISGIDVSPKNKDNQTPLHLAAIKGTRDACLLLLRKGARLDAADRYGRTPLHLSAYQGHYSIVKLFLKKEANKRSKDDSKSTPLHAAAARGSLECCEILAEADKVLYKEQDKKGRYPMDVAYMKGHMDVFQFFLQTLPFKNIKTLPQSMKEQLHSHTHKALKEKNWVALKAIVESPWWTTGFNTVSMHDDVPCTNFRELIKQYPQLAAKVMDKCVTLPSSTSIFTTYDFRLFEDNYCIKQEEKDGTSDDKKELLRTKSDPFDSNGTLMNTAEEFVTDDLKWYQDHPVNLMIDCKCLQLLDHQLTEAWLMFKWSSYLRCIYLWQLFVQIISLIFLIIFMTQIWNEKQIETYFGKNMTEFCKNITASLEEKDSSGDNRKIASYAQMTYLSYVFHIILPVILFLNIVMEGNNIHKLRIHYFSNTNCLVRLPCLVFMFVLWIPSFNCGGIKTVGTWKFGILALLLSPVYLVITLNKLPSLSVFNAITRSFISSFMKGLLYIILIICFFALIFHLVFWQKPGFDSLPQAIVKTVVWMLGDLGYDDTFLQVNDPIAYPVLSNILFLIFLCMVGVLLVTLVKTPSSNELEIALSTLSEQAQLFMKLDLCFPWFRRKFVRGRYSNQEDTWQQKLLTKMQSRLKSKPKKSVLKEGLLSQCDNITLMKLEEYRHESEPEKNWKQMMLDNVMKVFKSDIPREPYNIPDPFRDKIDDQTQKLDKLLELYNQLSQSYKKQNESILELKQQLEFVKDTRI